MALTGKYLELYQRSSFKEGILAWYPFPKDAKVLDISGGTLTGLLQSNCSQVDIYTHADASDIQDNFGSANNQYDFIVILDPIDFSISALKNYKQHLAPHGKLLVAYENPYALRFWAGHSAPNTGKPYDTLVDAGDTLLPTKKEFASRLKTVGFEGLKWYYPLADHWFTSEVYSDSYLPNEFFNHRLVSYITDDKNLQFDERKLYKKMVASGAFEFLCGAYLVEARTDVTDAACDIDYAAVTSYRAPDKRFATVLKDDGAALKIPLHDDAKNTAQRILANHQELAKVGIPVLAYEHMNGSLKMPRLHLPTLFDYWAKQFVSGEFCTTKVMQTYDRIAQYIELTSKSGKCYWELVPANCFYDEETDTLTFFDQEYYSTGVNSKVALARAVLGLKYSFAYATESVIRELCEKLISRYNLREEGILTEYAKLDTYSQVFGEEHRLLKQMSDAAALRIAERQAEKS